MSSQDLGHVRDLFEAARAMAVIPEGATVHFEGSLAEGFGNEGSDVDFLLIVPGSAKHAVMPTVLFVNGRRVEVRAQSHDQIRARLSTIRQAIDSGSIKNITEDGLNRVQRLLNGVSLFLGPGYRDLMAIVSYQELTELIAAWWRHRAGHCLRHSAALVMLDHGDEAARWAREGLTQTMKAFVAAHGEGYLEAKWLPEQIDRLRRRADRSVMKLIDEYQRLEDLDVESVGHHAFIEAALAFATRLGGPTVTTAPGKVILKRIPGVTTWRIGGTTHVVRGRADVFVLSAECADSWRRVVFGQTLATTRASHVHIATFVRYGLIALAWRGAGVLKPAAAMCQPDRPLTPPPSVRRPVITIEGAPGDGEIARSPLEATAFAECAGSLLLANMFLENVREDFNGAVKDEQWKLASLCGRRIATLAVRILASAWGVTPLPADPVLVDALEQLVPEHRVLASTARRMTESSIHDRDSALAVQADLDRLVAAIRLASGGVAFPSSFDSRDQWQKTIRYGYQWLRLSAYLNAYIELDEARDLLASGGVQPGERR